MSDVMNSIFGRPKNDLPESRETVDSEAIEVAQSEPASGVTEAAVSEDEVVESSPEAVSTAESADRDQTDEDLEGTADTLDAETAEAADDEAEAEAVVEAEPVAETAVVEAEPVAVEADEAPVVVAAEADEIEPAVEPAAAETRPAPGVRGSITMGDGVVMKIVTMVARKVEGVHALGDDGVSVMVDGDIATIEISLVTEFGYRLKTLAEQIRIKVIEAVEEFLGLDVEVVDIHVLDIHLPETD